MPDFSLELNEDQLQMQKWVHVFAENVVRPAASEWDEREETPYPIIEEAARIGLYSTDFLLNAFSDPTGLLLPKVWNTSVQVPLAPVIVNVAPAFVQTPAALKETTSPEPAVAATVNWLPLTALAGACTVIRIVCAAFCAVTDSLTSGAAL